MKVPEHKTFMIKRIEMKVPAYKRIPIIYFTLVNPLLHFQMKDLLMILTFIHVHLNEFAVKLLSFAKTNKPPVKVSLVNYYFCFSAL